MTKRDGGPAFPFNRTEAECYSGLSLRDYFAAAALQALLGNVNATGESIARLADSFAAHAYAQADAMLAERDKT